MDLTLYTQTYRCKSADRQTEIDECLRRNLNHPCIRKLVLFKESDAPPLPEATVELEVVESNTRITYAEWFRWVKRQGSGIGLLLNADIYLDQGLEHLAATFDTPEAFLALTRTNPGHAGFHLNDYLHWTEVRWGAGKSVKSSHQRDDGTTIHWDNYTLPHENLYRSESARTCALAEANDVKGRKVIAPKCRCYTNLRSCNAEKQDTLTDRFLCGNWTKQRNRRILKQPGNPIAGDPGSPDFQPCNKEAMAR